MNQTLTLHFFIRKFKQKLRALLRFCLQPVKKEKKSTTTISFKLKQENVYQTRKLNVTNIFPRFLSKNNRRDIPSRASTEFTAKQMKIRLPQLAPT